MHKYAIIVAGGSGSRMGGELPKQFQLLLGKPVLFHTLKAFTMAYDDIQLILVVPDGHLEKGELLANEFPLHRVRVTAGGATRFASVKNGLSLVDTHAIVFIHDGVRCLVTPSLIRRCAEAVLENENAIPAITSIDSIRIVSSSGTQGIDRRQVRIIQTPQTFLSNTIKQAYQQPFEDAFTDEASVVEKMGVPVHLVEGEATNIKITHPMDMIVAERILQEREGLTR